MSTCATVHQCIECDQRTTSTCIQCKGNHTLDTSSNSCKCGQTPACLDSEMCVQETGKCVASNACQADLFCTRCSTTDASQCRICVLGFQPNAMGICEEIPCGGIAYCSECDVNAPAKCAKCASGMILSPSNICECAENSGKGCPSDQICTPQRTCMHGNSCFSVVNCLRCDRTEPHKCGVCDNGFVVSSTGIECVASPCQDKYCGKCEDVSTCDGCQVNLQMQLVSRKCECVPGSETACPDGFRCARDSKICVKNDACMSLIPNCEQCFYHDQRKCMLCRAGFIISADKQICIAQDECMKIEGCQRCVGSIPNLCEQCSVSKVRFGQECKNNKLSTGGIVGIVVAVIVVAISVTVGVVLYKRKQKSVQVQNAHRDFT